MVQENKIKFQKLAHQYIQREGVTQLLDYLDTTDFYTAPSSTKFHLNVEGGLCQHCLNVFETALKIYHAVIEPAITAGTSPFKKEVTDESIAIVTLFHDLCKVGVYHKAEKWRKDAQNRWESYVGYEFDDDLPMGHGEKSVFILRNFIKLTREEILAVRWHMGMFDIGESGSSQRLAFHNACEKSALVSLVHAADFVSSQCLEETTKP